MRDYINNIPLEEHATEDAWQMSSDREKHFHCGKCGYTTYKLFEADADPVHDCVEHLRELIESLLAWRRA